MNYIVGITEILQVTHDVKCFRLEKPAGYAFHPGQATDVSINKPEMEEVLRPFTFTCLMDAPYLEFTIKRYPDRHGVTDLLHSLIVGDQLIIRDAWGAIEYKGPGYFIAGGAGITPFISILRDLHRQNKSAGNKLFFSNKTQADIIYHQELVNILGKDVVFMLTREKLPDYPNEKINKSFLEKNISDFGKRFYICGPDAMVAELVDTIQQMGASADTLVFEK